MSYKINEVVKVPVVDNDCVYITEPMKVIKIRDTEKEPISNKSYKYYKIQRSRYLLTCIDSTGHYRNVYDCKVQKLDFFEKLHQMLLKMVLGRR